MRAPEWPPWYRLRLCSCLPAVQANSSAYGRCTSRVTDASRAPETHCNGTGQTVSGALESCSHLPCLCCCSSTVIVYHLCLCSCLPAVQANSSAYGRCTSRVTDASRASETHCNDTGQTVVGAGTIIAVHLMHCSLALTVHVWFLNGWDSNCNKLPES